MSSLKLPAHGHTLFLLDTSKLFDMKGLPYWGCDACKRTSKEMQVTHSYRCMSCDFDVCKECCEAVISSAHEHKLVITDAKLIYPNGAWCCDNCRTDSRSQGRLMWHCEKGCLFDLCFGCTRTHKSLTHPHRLQKCNPKMLYPEKYSWSCNACDSDFMYESQEKPFNCKQCRFNICFKCLKETLDIKPQASPVPTPSLDKVNSVDGVGASDDPSTEDEEGAAEVFLSYNWNIQDQVLELKRNLESMNIKCWMDTGNMVGGDDLKKEIDKGMRGAKIVISCVTKAYSQSNACQQEVALADVLKKPILPVLFESLTWPPEGPMAMPFAPLIYVSLEDGLTRGNLEKVVKTIKSRTGMKG